MRVKIYLTERYPLQKAPIFYGKKSDYDLDMNDFSQTYDNNLITLRLINQLCLIWQCKSLYQVHTLGRLYTFT